MQSLRHVHHYFDNSDPEQIKYAMELRYKALQLFPNISVNKFLRYALFDSLRLRAVASGEHVTPQIRGALRRKRHWRLAKMPHAFSP